MYTDKLCQACHKKLMPKEVEAIIQEYKEQGAFESQINWAEQVCVSCYIQTKE